MSGYKYRAVRDLYPEGSSACAHRAGDLVHETAVEGDTAWLVLGDDVEPIEGASLDRPAKSASQAQWANYAVSRGMDADEASGMSRAALIAATEDE